MWDNIKLGQTIYIFDHQNFKIECLYIDGIVNSYDPKRSITSISFTFGFKKKSKIIQQQNQLKNITVPKSLFNDDKLHTNKGNFLYTISSSLEVLHKYRTLCKKLQFEESVGGIRKFIDLMKDHNDNYEYTMNLLIYKFGIK